MEKNSKLLKKLTYTSLCTALTVICSQICIPSPVPFTLQTFAISLSAAVLGFKYALLSVITYILLGAVGLPVFAGFRSGASVLFGATGGYIIGYIFFAAVSGFFCEKFAKSTHIMFFSMLFGLLICYIFGTLWYIYIYANGNIPIYSAFSVCVFPFIIPDILKIALAVFCANKVNFTII